MANSRAATVSGESRTTLLLSSTILPPWAHKHQWVQPLASPVAWPSAKPGGLPTFLSPWHNLRNPEVSLGNSSKPAACMALTR